MEKQKQFNKYMDVSVCEVCVWCVWHMCVWRRMGLQPQFTF